MEDKSKVVLEDMSTTLEKCGLAGLRGRPFDSAFEVFLRPPEDNKLIIMGLNGSLADKDLTNLESVHQDAMHPTIANLDNGLKVGWGGRTTLPERLTEIPGVLGFERQGTVFTNALLMCSKDANSLKGECEKVGISIAELERNSMKFFLKFTLRYSRPRLILAYSNSWSGISATKVLYEYFKSSAEESRRCSVNKYTSYRYFKIQVEGVEIPVIGIRHLSRFKPLLTVAILIPSSPTSFICCRLPNGPGRPGVPIGSNSPVLCTTWAK